MPLSVSLTVEVCIWGKGEKVSIFTPPLVVYTRVCPTKTFLPTTKMSAAAASSFPPKPIKAEPGTSSTRYTKPGQTLPTPSPGSGDRVFYESLLKENPDSA